MILHDLTFEDLATAPVKQTDVEVARQVTDPYGFYDDTLIWTSSDVLMSVSIDCVGAFLGTATKKATVKLLGLIDTATEGETFQVRLGLYNMDPSASGFNYISEGFYLVDNVSYDYEAGSTTIIMYDYMWKAQNTPYADSVNTIGFSYPATVEELALQSATILGAEFMAGFSSLPNADFIIETDPYENISNATIQSVIQEIAGATGTTARISDTTLVFSQYSIDSENLDSASLRTLKIGEKYGPVTSVVLGRIPQNDNVIIASGTPDDNVISSINTTTNLFTVTDNAMSDGNLVQIESTATLPAPLLADTSYFVYTGGDPNTFALASTYADAIAGTNLIDITTSGSGVIQLSVLDTKEVQINNNQILDKDRQDLLPSLYNELAGIEWNEVTSDTVGLGWHEVGDVINFTQGANTVKAFIGEIHLTLAGSIKESLVSAVPDVATINYQTAGGILRTIYNTEIEVDKQNNEITSIVSQQEVYQNETTDNFTEIYQNISDILLTVQKSGGGNLILNSVGFALESAVDGDTVQFDKLAFWDYNAGYQIDLNGTLVSYSSSESQNSGGASGQVLEFNGDGLIIEQHIDLAADTELCFGMRVNSGLGNGGCTVTIYNEVDSQTISVADMTSYEWQELKIENFISTMPWVNIKIESESAIQLQITDLRLLYGTTLQAWVQSAAEILSTNVQFTKNGMKIFDNVHDTETQVTYNEFSTRRRSDGVVLFEADDAGVVTNDLSVKGIINYIDTDGDVSIKQMTIPVTKERAGIVFIKVL